MRAHPAILRLAVMLGLIHAASTMAMTILVPCSQDILEPECDRLWHPPQAGCCRWCDWQPSRSRVCRTDRRTKQRLPCPHNDGRPFRDHSADVKPICYGVRTLERDDHSSALERCYRIVLPTSQSDDLPGRVDFLSRFFGWVLMAVAVLAGAGIVSIVTCSLRAEMAMRMPYFVVTAASVGLFRYGLSRLRVIRAERHPAPP